MGRKNNGGGSEAQPLLADKNGNVVPAAQPVDGSEFTDVVSAMTYISFALGYVPSQMVHTVISVFYSPFLLQVANISPSMASLILLLGRVWDAVTDPTIGFLTQNTHTRWGSLKPWLTGSVLPFSGLFVAMFCVPAAWEHLQRVAFAMATYLLFQTTLTGFSVPASALTVHISPDPKKRDKAVSLAMVFATIGTLAGATIQGAVTNAMIGDINSGCKVNCSWQNTSGYDDTVWDTGSSYEADPPKPNDLQVKVQETFIVGASTVAFICLVCGMFVILGVPEQKKLRNTKESETVGICEGLMIVFGSKPFVCLIGMILFAWMAVGTYSANNVLFLSYAVDAHEISTIIPMVMLGATVFSIPFCYALMAKFGKKRTYTGGLIFLSICFTSHYWFPYKIDHKLLYGINVIMGIAISPVYLVPLAMLPDVIDDATVKAKGKRNEVLFYSWCVFGQKFGTGIAVAIATACLDTFASFQSGCCKQPSDVAFVLHVVQGPFCGGLVLFSLISTILYPLTEKDIFRNKEALAQLREHAKTEAIRDGTVDFRLNGKTVDPGEDMKKKSLASKEL